MRADSSAWNLQYFQGSLKINHTKYSFYFYRQVAFFLMYSFTWFLIRLWVNIRTEGYTLSWSKKNVTFSSGKSFSLAYSSCPCYIQTKTNVGSSPSLPLLNQIYSRSATSYLCFSPSQFLCRNDPLTWVWWQRWGSLGSKRGYNFGFVEGGGVNVLGRCNES